VRLEGPVEERHLREATGEKRRRPDVVEVGRPETSPSPRPQPGNRTAPTRSPPARPVATTSADRGLSQRGRKETSAAAAARDQGRVPLAQRPSSERPVTGGTEAGEATVSQHVHDAFSHELKHLRGGLADGNMPSNQSSNQSSNLPADGVAATRAAPSQAAELVQLLRSPATIRQVILLREVLDRPVDRW
jgi:hypothetical protein